MENGKLWSGSKFAKCKTLFPDRFCLYEGCVSSVAANRVRQSKGLAKIIEKLNVVQDVLLLEGEFIKHNIYPNQWLSLIILLTVRVQQLIKIVRLALKEAYCNESS